MRTETRLLTYRKFSELTEEQKKKELSEFNTDSFYENADFIYDENMNELFSEINGGEYFYAERKKLSWQSNSQGWYFSHCGDYLKGNTELSEGIYRMEIYNASFSGYSSFDADYVIDNADFYRNGEYINFKEIANRKVKKDFLKFAEKIAEKGTFYNNRIKKIISDYDSYYPTDEEIMEYIIDNEIEFLTDNEILTA